MSSPLSLPAWSGGNTNLTSAQGGTGTWDTSTANWFNGASTTPSMWSNTNGADAAFGTSSGTVTIGANVSANSLIFSTWRLCPRRRRQYDNPGLRAIEDNAGSNAAGAIVVGGNTTINTTLDGVSGITVSGTATLTLGGKQYLQRQHDHPRSRHPQLFQRQQSGGAMTNGIVINNATLLSTASFAERETSACWGHPLRSTLQAAIP